MLVYLSMTIDRSNKADGPVKALSSETCRMFRKALADWYAHKRRDLPWRRTNDPYKIWVSEVMLQQTQVQTVAPYYQRFLERFPDVHALARSDLQVVLKLWEGLGYYSRARNLHKAAIEVSTDVDGRIPDQWETLRALPGIGDYIAAAVLSIAFEQPYAVVDGNVKRVLARIFLLDTPVNYGPAHKSFQTLAAQLLDTRKPGDHNQAMMELGAVICTPRNPTCAVCSLADLCGARKKGATHLYPRRNKRTPVDTRRMVAGVVLKKGRILMVQRPETGLLGGLWEFPCGPVKKGENVNQVCTEQLQSSVNLVIKVDHRVATVFHVYTHFKLQLDVCLCLWQSGRIRLNGPVAYKWIEPSRIGDLPLHGVVHKALDHLSGLI